MVNVIWSFLSQTNFAIYQQKVINFSLATVALPDLLFFRLMSIYSFTLLLNDYILLFVYKTNGDICLNYIGIG
ncbi:Uncharacterised protein [Yersinia frederiksenii]|jgi:hypothetical protein|uniref:Uncharacterized protein n=1 Tax=Yersinia frederiksenii TaxID=29484 RepID=A0AAI8ZT71_YERFR|nr:Uncharacterised protein [Yersinia frederiksenii]CQH58620.1 Uncharacterised protein [Yersinia frederiksenii]